MNHTKLCVRLFAGMLFALFVSCTKESASEKCWVVRSGLKVIPMDCPEETDLRFISRYPTKMMNRISAFLLSVFLLMACVGNKSNKEQEQGNGLEGDVLAMEEASTVIAGEILNRKVYPHIKEVKLTIPGFDGDETVFTTVIDDSGRFAFRFYPKTQREVQLYPIEDILVVQPGDSLYVVKDFKDIGVTSFYGDGAELNRMVSEFNIRYLGRYPTDYQQRYLAYKNACDHERSDIYQRLVEFQEKQACPDAFNNWANKRIELDYYSALFDYSLQYGLRTKEVLTDTTDYFSFLDELEANVDNSIVMSGYFTVSKQYMQHRLKENPFNSNIDKDEAARQQMEALYSGTQNSYLAQFVLSSYLNIYLHANQTDMLDQNREWINSRLDDPFLRNTLQARYDRVQAFKNNPKRTSDALLNAVGSMENTGNISLQSTEETNPLKQIVTTNPDKVVYIDFWATWCPPCLNYMQRSRQEAAELTEKGVVIVYVCILSKKNHWQSTINDLNLSGQHIFLDNKASQSVRKQVGFSGIPYYLLINKKGIIVDYGNHLQLQNQDVIKHIEQLLNE